MNNLRLPIPKKPVVKIRWGSSRESLNDLHVAWGPGVPRSTARWLVWELSKLEAEMKSRGLDISTLKFDISALPEAPQPEAANE